MESIISYISRQLSPQYPPTEAKALASIIGLDLLGLSIADFYGGKDTDLSAENLHKLQYIINRLLRHEPIQYIAGSTNFCDLTFRVNPDVLIPRPETAELVGHLVRATAPQADILDIGTGSGCIAIAISHALPQAHVTAWDVSPQALEVARYNNHKCATKVTFELRDIFDPHLDHLSTPRYDVVVSNPPYVTIEEQRDMQPEVLEYEPHLALFVPDDDPLRFYRRIAAIGRSMLRDGGYLYFEINRRYGPQTAQLLTGMGYQEAKIVRDDYQNDRFIIARK